ncbi:MAG TPA: L-2-amino-thiazoline-4-carboxylic acid hydrolase [Anaeromyxobacteraceae bacterium]|nr:L-2-amino-thiazoline-4-carboxylic acid hydrolase [Anaeromyxobacteraceae bacterium]
MSIPQEIGILERRRIEAEILAPVLDELEAALGVERASALLSRAVARVARESGRALRKGWPGGGLEGLRALWESLGRGGALDVRLEEAEGSLRLRVTRCAYAELYRRLGRPRLGLVLSCGRDAPLLEGYSDALALERTACLLEDDDRCEITYRRKP